MKDSLGGTVWAALSGKGSFKKYVALLVVLTLLSFHRAAKADDIFNSAEFGELASVQALVISNKVPVDVQDSKGNTPLMWAIMMGHIDVAKFLLSKGANPSITNKDGNSPLLSARALGIDTALNLPPPTPTPQAASEQISNALSFAQDRTNLTLQGKQYTGIYDVHLLPDGRVIIYYSGGSLLDPTNLPDGFLSAWSISASDIAQDKLITKQQNQMARDQVDAATSAGNQPQQQNADFDAQNSTDNQHSLDKWLTMVQAAVNSQRPYVGHGLSRDYENASAAVQNALESASSSYPDPIFGDQQKVSSILEEVQGKLKSVGVNFGYDRQAHLWAIFDRNGGCLFQLSDLDPTSAQVVTVDDTSITGTTRYFVRLTTKNNAARVIGYTLFLGIPGISTVDHISIPCGFGPVNEETAERVGKAIAALAVAYGGEAEVVN